MLRSLREVPKWAAIRPPTSSDGDKSACTIANWSSASFLASVSMITRRRLDGFITLLQLAVLYYSFATVYSVTRSNLSSPANALSLSKGFDELRAIRWRMAPIEEEYRCPELPRTS